MFTDDTTPAAPAPEAAPESPAVEAAPVVETGKDWTRALVLAGGGMLPRGETRPVVVAEVRGDDGALLSAQSYPKGADLYVRFDPAAPVGDAALTLGRDLEQGLLSGLSVIPGVVHVGPAHPAYAAVNLATLAGAAEVEVAGLSALWKERLAPWFDRIATDPRFPSDVKITLT